MLQERMDNENEIVKAKLEDKDIWQEPRFWDSDKDGIFTVNKISYERIFLDIWMDMQDED